MNLSLILKRIRGCYFFPIISFVVSLIYLKDNKILFLFFLVISLVRIYLLKNQDILMVTICFVFLAFIFHIDYTNRHKEIVSDESFKSELKIYPDSMKVDGDLLSMKAVDLATNEKVMVRYTFKEESEKEKILNTTRTLLIKGNVENQEIEKARNLHGFDYAEYLDSTGISKQVKLESIEDCHTYPLPLYQINWKIKEWRRGAIVHNQKRFGNLTEDYMNSLLFGYQNNSSGSYQLTWKKLGVAHLFSLSGMHIYFFLTLFDFCLLRFFLTKEQLFKYNLGFTFFIVLITGSGPGMIRAGLQHVIKQLNQRFNWQLSVLDCWSLALFINCIFHPYVLLTVGGQLTYYLTFLIIFIMPIIKKVNNPFIKGIVFNVLLSILSLPLIWFYFYEWNLLSFGINLVLGPVLFLVIMPLLLLTFGLSFIFQKAHFGVAEQFLSFFQRIGDTVNTFDCFRQVVGRIPILLLFILLFSQLLILICWEKNGIVMTKKLIALSSITVVTPFIKYVNPIGMIAFVDIGQGDSIFVQLPFHQGNYLLDTGGTLGFEVEDWKKRSDKRGADYTLIPFLKSQGVKKLDTVFISHAHEDHFGDLDRLSDSVKIKNLCFGPGSYDQSNFKRYLAYPSLKKTKKKAVTYQNKWQKTNYNLDCLYPLETGDGQNNDSLVMMLSIKDRKILLMGDLEAEGENELLAQKELDLQADILKVGHHGSKTSSQSTFLERVTPDMAVISCGKNNRYNHPSKETLDNLTDVNAEIFRTDENGMVYFTWQPFSKTLSKAKMMK